MKPGTSVPLSQSNLSPAGRIRRRQLRLLSAVLQAAQGLGRERPQRRIHHGDLVQRIRVLQGISGRVDLSIVPFEYLSNLLDAEVLRQASPGLGISITDEDIDRALRDQFYPTKPVGQETDPGQLDEEFRNTYQIFLARRGFLKMTSKGSWKSSYRSATYGRS